MKTYPVLLEVTPCPGPCPLRDRPRFFDQVQCLKLAKSFQKKFSVKNIYSGDQLICINDFFLKALIFKVHTLFAKNGYTANPFPVMTTGISL